MPQIKIDLPRPKWVGPIGPKEARIAIVGEAPGEEEESTGVPFVGKTGQVLTKLLTQAGLSRPDLYITNVIKYRPPGNRLENLHTIGIDQLEEEEKTRQELKALNPSVIIAVGGTALRAITGIQGITKWRGSILNWEGIKVIPTLHPSYLVRGQFHESCLVLLDLMKARKESLNRDPYVDHRIARFNLTYDELCNDLSLLKQDVELGETLISLDIETDFGINYIKCVGFAIRKDFSFVVPIVEELQPKWSLEEEENLWWLMRSILLHKNAKIIVQNMGMEFIVLYEWIGEMKIFFDTIIAHHLIYPELKKNLGLQTSIYTNHPFYKDDAKNQAYAPQALYLYNARDCMVTFEIYEVLDKLMKYEGLTKFFYDYQMPLCHILCLGTIEGILVDTKKIWQYQSIAQQELKLAQDKLNALLKEPLNVNSPKQMGLLLYDKMKLPKQYKRTPQGRRLTTDEDAMVRLSKMFPSPIFSLILEVRQKSKLISTYLKEFWDKDSRCRPSWNITGAVTGRLACSENLRGTGLNMQNIPRNIRDSFIADPGCLLYKVDLSQVESRLVAYMSQDLNMMRVFEDGGDIHCLVASMLYGIPLNKLNKQSPERDPAKVVGHAANYKVGPNKLSSEAGVSVAEAKVLLEKYYSRFNIGKWHDSVVEELAKNRSITTPFGRKRKFFGMWSDELFRSAIAHNPQSTAVDHINQALTRIYKRIPKDIKFLLQVHDELVFNCPKGKIQYLDTIVRNELKKPIIINNREVIIPLDIQIGQTWKG